MGGEGAAAAGRRLNVQVQEKGEALGLGGAEKFRMYLDDEKRVRVQRRDNGSSRRRHLIRPSASHMNASRGMLPRHIFEHQRAWW